MRALIALSWVAACAAGSATSVPAGENPFTTTLTRGGIVVHIGCGDGELTATLRGRDRVVVHGLDSDPANVREARSLLRERGLYGPVSVAKFDGERLPYADDLVNAVIVSDAARFDIAPAEIARVLRPGGTSWIEATAGEWTRSTKPWPAEIDDWSHFLHDASNDCTAKDRRVAPPQRMIWRCGPLWARSHEHTSSLVAMVTAKGRIYYIFDEGLTSLTGAGIPERWTLIARDAFNGVLLWKRRLDHWRDGVWTNRSLRGVLPSVQRLLVAEADRVFTPLSLAAPVSIIDGDDGDVLATCEGSGGAQELRCSNGVLLVRHGKKGLLAFDAHTGVRLWAVGDQLVPNTLAAGGSRVFYQAGAVVKCVDSRTGDVLWKTADAPDAAGKATTDRKGRKVKSKKAKNAAPIIVCGESLLQSDATGLRALSVSNGDIAWERRARLSQHAFVVDGKLWELSGQGMAATDIVTGKKTASVDASDVFTPGHHLRCYQGKATVNYAITPNRGVEFVSLTGRANSQHDWVRGACRYGILPANGMVYMSPHPCFCYPGVKLMGFNALAGGVSPTRTTAARLEKGPAYAPSTSKPLPSTDWPTYRHDARRSGATACSVPAAAKPLWETRLGSPLTPPVCAAGRVYVAAKDEHTLYALAAVDGAIAWIFTAGGRIDSPPTACGDRILLGCADGHLYCLRASDGALAWRLRVAPDERLIVSDSQLESAWPVHGSVLVEGDVAYATAGRSTYLDGGIRAVAVDVSTGRVLNEATLDTWSRTRDDAVGKPFVAGYHMEGTLSDILVAEGGHLYMGQYKLDAKLRAQDMPYVIPGKSDPKPKALDLTGQPFSDKTVAKTEGLEKHQRDWVEKHVKSLAAKLRKEHGAFNYGHREMGRHVFSTSGFLDDSWFNRTFWMYADSWPGFYIANVSSKAGQLLVVGAKKTYAVQAFPDRNLQSPLFTPGKKGYLLVADANDNEPFLEDRTRETTKGWGFTRRKPPLWHDWVPIRMRAMVLAADTLFVAGPPDGIDADDPMAAFEGRRGAILRAVRADDGETLAERKLASPPVFDGLIAAAGCLFVSTVDGKVVCLGVSGADSSEP